MSSPRRRHLSTVFPSAFFPHPMVRAQCLAGGRLRQWETNLDCGGAVCFWSAAAVHSGVELAGCLEKIRSVAALYERRGVIDGRSPLLMRRGGRDLKKMPRSHF